jgi:hypothetical protein
MRRNQIFVFRRNGRVHLNRQGRQFSRLLAAEVCASAVAMLDTPCFEVVWGVLATHSIRQFPLHFPSRASPCAITLQLDSTYPDQVLTQVYHASLGKSWSTDVSGLPVKGWPCRHSWIVTRWHISTTLNGGFSLVLVSSVVRRMPGYNTRSALPSDMAASPKCLIFAASLNLDMTSLSSNPRKPFSQSYAPHKGLLPLERWSSVCPRRGLQTRRETR